MSCNIQILISNWLRTRKFSHFLQARKAVAFGFSHHVHELVTLWLVKNLTGHLTWEICASSGNLLRPGSSGPGSDVAPLIFHSNFREKLFFKKKISRWMSAKHSQNEGAASCKRVWKAGILARNSHTSVTSDWTYHFSHAWKNIVRDPDWTYHFFHVWKTSFAPLIG